MTAACGKYTLVIETVPADAVTHTDTRSLPGICIMTGAGTAESELVTQKSAY